MSSTSSTSSIIASFVVQFQDTKCNQLLNKFNDQDIKVTFAEPTVTEDECDSPMKRIDPIIDSVVIQVQVVLLLQIFSRNQLI